MVDLIENIINLKVFNSNKAQLGWIEFKFFFFGLILGLIVALILISLSCNDIFIPKIGFMCG